MSNWKTTDLRPKDKTRRGSEIPQDTFFTARVGYGRCGLFLRTQTGIVMLGPDALDSWTFKDGPGPTVENYQPVRVEIIVKEIA